MTDNPVLQALARKDELIKVPVRYWRPHYHAASPVSRIEARHVHHLCR